MGREEKATINSEADLDLGMQSWGQRAGPRTESVRSSFTLATRILSLTRMVLLLHSECTPSFHKHGKFLKLLVPSGVSWKRLVLALLVKPASLVM